MSVPCQLVPAKVILIVSMYLGLFRQQCLQSIFKTPRLVSSWAHFHGFSLARYFGKLTRLRPTLYFSTLPICYLAIYYFFFWSPLIYPLDTKYELKRLACNRLGSLIRMLNTKTHFFFKITFDFFMHFKKENFFFSFCFLVQSV